MNQLKETQKACLNVLGSDIRTVPNWDLVRNVEGLRSSSWNPKRLGWWGRSGLGGSETWGSVPHILQHLWVFFSVAVISQRRKIGAEVSEWERERERGEGREWRERWDLEGYYEMYFEFLTVGVTVLRTSRWVFSAYVKRRFKLKFAYLQR